MNVWLNKKFIILTLAIIICTSIFSYFVITKEKSNALGTSVSVDVAKVIVKKVRPWHEFSGLMVAVEQVEVRSRVAGSIEEVHFKNGAMVKKGDLLFTIDQRLYKANLEAAQANYNYTSAEYKRVIKLLEKKAISKSDFDTKFNSYQQAKSALTKAQLDMDNTTIRSPIHGKVSRAQVTLGNLVEAGPNSSILTTIVSIDPIYVDFDIDELTFLEYINVYNKDNVKIPVMLKFAPEDKTVYKSYIESFGNQLNSKSGTIQARAIFSNKDGKLVPGLFARVLIGSAVDKTATLITDRAIGTDQNKKYVLVVGEDNKVYYREVKLGNIVEGLRIIKSGLEPNDKIIINGLQHVRPGQEIKVHMVSMDISKPSAYNIAQNKNEKIKN